MKPKAYVSEKKKKELNLLVKLIESSERFAILDLTSLPSPQFQKMRKKLQDSLNLDSAQDLKNIKNL